MKIEIETESYNARRYGRPYIAVVDFCDDGSTEPEWGSWVGEISKGNGSEGLLLIEAEPGDILMQGQKDNRGSNGTPEFFEVLAGEEPGDYEFGPVMKKSEAFKRFREVAKAREIAAKAPAPDAPTAPGAPALHERTARAIRALGALGLAESDFTVLPEVEGRAAVALSPDAVALLETASALLIELRKSATAPAAQN
jgi:hypothetical protein